MMVFIRITMKTIFILDPLEVVLHKPNDLYPSAVILLLRQWLRENCHILVIQKRESELSLPKAIDYVMRPSSLDLEEVAIRLVEILK